MADLLPPAPIDAAPNSYAWIEWYRNIRNVVNQGNNIAWSSINKAGSNLSDIGIRLHNTLQSMQGGTTNEFYHLSNAQYTTLLATQAAPRSSKGIDTTDDIIIDLATKGLVLKDTQATPHYWRVKISTLGALTTTDLGTTKP